MKYTYREDEGFSAPLKNLIGVGLPAPTKKQPKSNKRKPETDPKSELFGPPVRKHRSESLKLKSISEKSTGNTIIFVLKSFRQFWNRQNNIYETIGFLLNNDLFSQSIDIYFKDEIFHLPSQTLKEIALHNAFETVFLKKVIEMDAHKIPMDCDSNNKKKIWKAVLELNEYILNPKLLNEENFKEGEKIALNNSINDLIDEIKYFTEPNKSKIYNSLIRIALVTDHVELFGKIIKNYSPNDMDEIETQAQSKITKMLNYGERQYLGEETQPIKLHLRKKSNDLNPLIEDFENTSDNSSSDSKEDPVHLLNNIEKKDTIFARGIPFVGFSKEKKLEMRDPNSHMDPLYSFAIQDLSKKFKIDPETANKFNIEYLNSLKKKPYGIELTEQGKRRIRRKTDFGSLYLALIHIYVNKFGYPELFDKKGMERNFGACSSKNPFISVTVDLEVAGKYASNQWSVNKEKFSYIKVREDGTIKHTRLGCIEIYKDLLGTDVDNLVEEKKISVHKRYHTNRETVMESFIPKEARTAFKVLSLPSFKKKYTKSIQDRYGLSFEQYHEFSEQLKNKSLRQKALGDLIKTAVSYQVEKIQETIEHLKTINSKSEQFNNQGHNNQTFFGNFSTVKENQHQNENFPQPI